MSRNYRRDSCPAEISCSYNKYLPPKRSFKSKYASFKNIQFPRGNYQPIVPSQKHSTVKIDSDNVGNQRTVLVIERR